MIRLLTVASLLVIATSAHAQSVPPISRSKDVATKAANAASNRVRTQEAAGTEQQPADAGRTGTPGGKAPAGSKAADSASTTAGRTGANAARPNTTQGRANPSAGRPNPTATRPGSTQPAANAGRPTTPASRNATLAARDTTARAGVDSVRPESPGTTKELVLMREVYRYDQGGRRDPFVSLMESGDLRPVPADLRLIGVIYDPTGRRSLATLRDVTTKELYRVAVGNVLGRTRITHIQPKQITMTIEEFGFSRQLVLILGDTTDTRSQR